MIGIQDGKGQVPQICHHPGNVLDDPSLVGEVNGLIPQRDMGVHPGMIECASEFSETGTDLLILGRGVFQIR